MIELEFVIPTHKNKLWRYFSEGCYPMFQSTASIAEAIYRNQVSIIESIVPINTLYTSNGRQPGLPYETSLHLSYRIHAQ